MRRLLSFLGLLVLPTLTLQPYPHGTVHAAGLDRQPPALLNCTGKDGVSPRQMRKAQEAWARYLGCKVEETVEIAKGVTMTFVLVPAGKFKMGSPETEPQRENDETQHTVTLTEPFYLGKYEVTQEQYQTLTGKKPSEFQGASLPVEKVSWIEARDYAAKLTAKRKDKSTYRLPSEAEWEYACRAGRPSSQPFGIGDGHSLFAPGQFLWSFSLWRGRQRAQSREDGARGLLQGKRIGSSRPARQRGGMVPGLVWLASRA